MVYERKKRLCAHIHLLYTRRKTMVILEEQQIVGKGGWHSVRYTGGMRSQEFSLSQSFGEML